MKLLECFLFSQFLCENWSEECFIHTLQQIFIYLFCWLRECYCNIWCYNWHYFLRCFRSHTYPKIVMLADVFNGREHCHDVTMVYHTAVQLSLKSHQRIQSTCLPHLNRSIRDLVWCVCSICVWEFNNNESDTVW